MPGGSSSSDPRTAASDVWLNSGPGQRLDGRGSGPDVTSSQNNLLGGVSEEEQLAMAISASMTQEDGDGQKTSAPTERVTSAPRTAALDEEVEDEMAQAIALSLSEGGADGRPSPTPSIAEVYTLKPVPEEEPTGADVVRIQVHWTLPDRVDYVDRVGRAVVPFKVLCHTRYELRAKVFPFPIGVACSP